MNKDCFVRFYQICFASHYDVRRVSQELELVDEHLAPGSVAVGQPEEVEQQFDVVGRQVQLFFC